MPKPVVNGVSWDRVGFTGTQHGMTLPQRERLDELLQNGGGWGHHGDCVGADYDFHVIARKRGRRICLHPPTNPVKRANCLLADKVIAPHPYLKRNRAIVDATGVLIATPNTYVERVRSGTWSTVRYARKRNRHIFIVFPDGSVRHEPPGGGGV